MHTEMTLWNTFETFISSNETMFSFLDDLPYHIHPTSAMFEYFQTLRAEVLSNKNGQSWDSDNIRIMVRKLGTFASMV